MENAEFDLAAIEYYEQEVDNDDTTDPKDDVIRMISPSELSVEPLSFEGSENRHKSEETFLMGDIVFTVTRRCYIACEAARSLLPKFLEEFNGLKKFFSGCDTDDYLNLSSDKFLEVKRTTCAVVKDFSKRYGYYSETTEFLENAFDYFGDELTEIYNEVVSDCNRIEAERRAEREYRKIRKAGRSRYYGFTSAGRTSANVSNTFSWIGHTLMNTVGNTFTDIAASSAASNLLNSNQRLKRIYSILDECVWALYSGATFSVETRHLYGEIAEEMYQEIITKELSDEDFLEDIRIMLEDNPMDSRAYIAYVARMGDMDYSVEETYRSIVDPKGMGERKEYQLQVTCEELKGRQIDLEIEENVENVLRFIGAVELETVIIDALGMSYNQIRQANRTVYGVVLEDIEEKEAAGEEILLANEKFRAVDPESIVSVRKCKEWIREHIVTSARRHFLAELNAMDKKLRTADGRTYDTYKEAKISEERVNRLKSAVEKNFGVPVFEITNIKNGEIMIRALGIIEKEFPEDKEGEYASNIRRVYEQYAEYNRGFTENGKNKLRGSLISSAIGIVVYLLLAAIFGPVWFLFTLLVIKLLFTAFIFVEFIYIDEEYKRYINS